MRQGLVFLLSLLATGCSALTTETTGDAGAALPTSVSMDPESFLVGAVCAELPGAMQSYVATVIDVTDPLAPFPLPSSPPTACTQSVYFDYVGLNRVYEGVIDGYTQPASDLVPACSIPGSAQSCQVDSDCPTVFGCAGACQVTVWQAQDSGCLTNCKIDTSCVADNNGCASNNVDTYVQCLEDCVQGCKTGGDTCVMNKETAISCLMNSPTGACTTRDGSKILQPCGSTPAPSLNGKPAGVESCNCEYATASGDRHMYSTNGAPLTPRWTTPTSMPCGNPPDYGCPDPNDPTDPSGGCPLGPCFTGDLCLTPTQSYENTGLVGCGMLQDADPGSTPTAIQLDPTSTLQTTSLACETGSTTDADGGMSGAVTSFDITPTDASLQPYLGVTCSASTKVTWNMGIVDGGSYVFSVQAYQLGASMPTQQASCYATASEGVTVLAMCDPLVPIPMPSPPPPKPAPPPPAKIADRPGSARAGADGPGSARAGADRPGSARAGVGSAAPKK